MSGAERCSVFCNEKAVPKPPRQTQSKKSTGRLADAQQEEREQDRRDTQSAKQRDRDDTRRACARSRVRSAFLRDGLGATAWLQSGCAVSVIARLSVCEGVAPDRRGNRAPAGTSRPVR